MSRDQTVECPHHGPQREAFVCQHIAASLTTGLAVGFHWPADSKEPHPDAWCTSCDEARIAAGGDWTPDVEEKLGITLLCGSCYEAAKRIWVRAVAKD